MFKKKLMNNLKLIQYHIYNHFKHLPGDKLCHQMAASIINQNEICKVNERWNQPKIIIIGAGIAGLSAANYLLKCGLNNFIILDGRERAGGRILTSWLGDSVCELGAQCLKGANLVNPVYSLAATEDLIKEPKKLNDCGKEIFLTSDGRAIDDYYVENNIFNEICRSFTLPDPSCPSQNKVNVSMNHLMALRINQHLLTFPEEERYDAERILFGIANRFKAKYGCNLNDLSSVMLLAEEKFLGGDLKISLGLVGITAALIRLLPLENIKYCKTVSQINWEKKPSNPQAIVHCFDEDFYEADYVIITIPLGVLKKKVDEMFYPALPNEKLEAIFNLGWGHIDNYYLEYKQPWWNQSNGTFHIGWSQDEMIVNETIDWTKSISTIRDVPGSKNILTFTLGGEETCFAETCPEETLAIDFTKFIRRFTNNPDIPYPNHFMRSSWTNDPYSRGGVSFMAPCTKPKHIIDLSKPFPSGCELISEEIPILFFAGEHTVKIPEMSTLQGAFISGFREADRIVKLTKRYQGPPPIPEMEIEKSCSSSSAIAM